MGMMEKQTEVTISYGFRVQGLGSVVRKDSGLNPTSEEPICSLRR